MLILNFILSFLLIINYHLALVYIGVEKRIKDTLVPSLLLAIIAFTSKIIFIAPPVIHTIVLVLSCTLILYFINKVDFLLGIIGSLLSFMTLTFGSLLVACPLVVYLGFNIPEQNEISGNQWTILTIMEFFIPALVLIILKSKKLSFVKLIKINDTGSV